MKKLHKNLRKVKILSQIFAKKWINLQKDDSKINIKKRKEILVQHKNCIL